MERKISHVPNFDFESLTQKCALWKSNGISEVFLEWSTGNGPAVFYYPAGERRHGVRWAIAVDTNGYSEAYADFLEHDLVPKLCDTIRNAGATATARCVDLQPLQVQRMRRREIARMSAPAASGH